MTPGGYAGDPGCGLWPGEVAAGIFMDTRIVCP